MPIMEDKAVQVGQTLLIIRIRKQDVVTAYFMVSTDMPFLKMKKAMSRFLGVPLGRLCFTFDSRYIFDDDTVETMGIHNDDKIYVTDNTEGPAEH